MSFCLLLMHLMKRTTLSFQSGQDFQSQCSPRGSLFCLQSNMLEMVEANLGTKDINKMNRVLFENENIYFIVLK